MNYQRIYNQIIERAQIRKLEGYKEKHHIIPRCIDGLDIEENIVELTAREHFLCHILLCEIHPNNIKLLYAVFMMSNIKKRKNFQYGNFISSRLYESLKLKRSKFQIEQWYKKRKEQGLVINEENINKFIELYPNIILSKNNKHCINYCYNNNIDIRNIICLCGKGIKRFQNYTKGYKKYCNQKCANFYNKKQSLQTKENKGLWTNSKVRLRKQEINGLSEKQISQLKNQKISQKLKGRFVDWTGDNINQYDLEGNFIKEWPSIRQAGLEIKGTNGETIRKCLKGLQKTAYGFIWKYTSL
jgi:hypothetical protein